MLPGGVLGDVHRAVRHGRGVGDVRQAVKAVVLERTAGQIVLVSSVVTVLVLAPHPALPQVSTTTTAIALVVAVSAAVLVWCGTARWAATVRAWTRDVRSGLLSSGNRLGILTASIGILAGYLVTFLIAARAAGSTASIAQLVPLLMLALLAMTLPLNVGGWGPREGATAWAFGAAGLGAAQGLTTAVVYGMLALIASLPGAAVVAADWIARTRAERQPQPATVTTTALVAVS
jgi:uncharacterized membrane protein YbhN (UPF0104 family)